MYSVNVDAAIPKYINYIFSTTSRVAMPMQHVVGYTLENMVGSEPCQYQGLPTRLPCLYTVTLWYHIQFPCSERLCKQYHSFSNIHLKKHVNQIQNCHNNYDCCEWRGWKLATEHFIHAQLYSVNVDATMLHILSTTRRAAMALQQAVHYHLENMVGNEPCQYQGLPTRLPCLYSVILRYHITIPPV